MGLLPSPAIRLLAGAVLLAIGVTVVQADGHEHMHHKKIVIHVPDNVHYHHHQHFSKLIVPVKQHHHEPHIEISHEHHDHDHDHAASTSSESGSTDLTWSATKGLGASWANSLKSLGHTAYSLGGHGLTGHGGYSFGGHKFAGYTGGSGSTSTSTNSGGSSEDTGSSATTTVESGSVNGLIGSSSNTAGSTVSLLGSDSLASYATPQSYKHSGVSVLTLAGHATPARANPFAWLQSHGWHTSPGATLRSSPSTHAYSVRASKGWRAPRAYTLVPAKRWRAAVLPAPPAVTATATPAAAAAAAAAAVALAKAPAFKPMTAVRAIPAVSAYKPAAVAITARVKV